VMSAIDKQPVTGAVQAQRLGLQGDEQADLSVHGGVSKAVYAYAHAHYATWQTIRAQALRLPEVAALPAGVFGENLTLDGVLEQDVWVGDRLRFAHCTLVVTEPRLPCFKFNLRMGFAHAAKMMVQSGWCGFYLAVLDEGPLTPGETFRVEPGAREVSIAELFELRTRRQRQQGLF
ncbi:MAG: MOSC domain-containing protein, partial [Betaproteobacteria bacterium]|nr:MOSC domain-containing protein [Betaproteobacteria bacterium]